jgi:Flp pilus assembly protein TadG
MDLRVGRRVSRRGGGRGDRGAAAVEFALLAVPLFTLLFGAIEYGLYFADVQMIERATADAARDATLSVGNTGLHWTGTTSCANPPTVSDLAKLICQLNNTVQPLGGGKVYAEAEIVDASGNPAVAWAQGNQLRVCSLTRYTGVLPFVPLPGGGVISTRVDMPIQPGGPAFLTLTEATMDVTSIGLSWSQC